MKLSSTAATSFAALALALSSLTLGGCAADVGPEDDTATDTASDEQAMKPGPTTDQLIAGQGGCSNAMIRSAAKACGGSVSYCYDSNGDGYGSAKCGSGGNVDNFGGTWN